MDIIDYRIPLPLAGISSNLLEIRKYAHTADRKSLVSGIVVIEQNTDIQASRMVDVAGINLKLIKKIVVKISVALIAEFFGKPDFLLIKKLQIEIISFFQQRLPAGTEQKLLNTGIIAHKAYGIYQVAIPGFY